VLAELMATLEIPDLDVVPLATIVPICANNLMLSLYVVFEVIFLCKRVEIGVYLPATGINSRPVKLRLKAPGVIV